MANLTNGQKVWQNNSVPTATDFNNIEGNLKKHTHPTADLSDVLQVSNGGTGATTAAANQVLAGPASGSASPPTWRTLTAAQVGALPSVGGTLDGNIDFSVPGTSTANANTGWRGIGGVVSANDNWIVRGYNRTGTNEGALEMATGDDGTEPIFIRQYGASGTAINCNTESPNLIGSTRLTAGTWNGVRQAVLLDANGNTSFPGAITAGAGISATHCRQTTFTTNKDTGADAIQATTTQGIKIGFAGLEWSTGSMGNDNWIKLTPAQLGLNTIFGVVASARRTALTNSTPGCVTRVREGNAEIGLDTDSGNCAGFYVIAWGI